MKKNTAIIFVLAIVLAGCKNSTFKSSSLMNDDNPNNSVSTLDTDQIDNTQTASEEKKPNNSSDKLCGWIDDSDVIIKLDLPEEYAYYNDENISQSYETGFMFKSSYGDVASSRRLARKGCDYRVGFSKEDFADMNINPNYPLVILIKNGPSIDLSYDGEPLKITLKDDLPEQGNEFIVKINGETQSFGHYDEIYK
jgi:hypothetical protein